MGMKNMDLGWPVSGETDGWKEGTSHNNDEEVSEREREETKTEERERDL